MKDILPSFGATNKSAPPHDVRACHWASACYMASGATALWVLLLWLLGLWRLGTLGSGYVPMAPSTAVCLLALAVSGCLRLRRPESAACLLFGRVVGYGLLAGSLLVLAESLWGFYLPVREWFALPVTKLGDIPVGRMSPLTAIALSLVSLAFLFELPPRPLRRGMRKIAALLSLSVVLLGLCVAMGYVLKTPLLYGGTTIPMAAITAVAFILVGLGLLLSAGNDVWPLDLVLFDHEHTVSAADRSGLRCILPAPFHGQRHPRLLLFPATEG